MAKREKNVSRSQESREDSRKERLEAPTKDVDDDKTSWYEHTRQEGMTFSTFRIPEVLLQRGKSVAKQMSTSLSQILRDAFSDRVDYLEAKLRADRERIEAERKANRGFRRMTPINPEPLHPVLPQVQEEKKEDPKPEYTTHALRIAEAVAAGNPLETRLRVAEALADIKRKWPLTHPSENEMVAILEKLVVEQNSKLNADQQTQQPQPTAPSTTQPTVENEIVIDPKKVRTLGKV